MEEPLNESSLSRSRLGLEVAFITEPMSLMIKLKSHQFKILINFQIERSGEKVGTKGDNFDLLSMNSILCS